jgi:hypothetical protein
MSGRDEAAKWLRTNLAPGVSDPLDWMAGYAEHVASKSEARMRRLELAVSWLLRNHPIQFGPIRDELRYALDGAGKGGG